MHIFCFWVENGDELICRWLELVIEEGVVRRLSMNKKFEIRLDLVRHKCRTWLLVQTGEVSKHKSTYICFYAVETIFDDRISSCFASSLPKSLKKWFLLTEFWSKNKTWIRTRWNHYVIFYTSILCRNLTWLQVSQYLSFHSIIVLSDHSI